MLSTEMVVSLEACPTAAFVLDAAGIVVFANIAARRLFHPRDSLDGLSVEMLLPDWPPPSQASPCRIGEGSGHEKSARVRWVDWQTASGTMTTLFIEAERKVRQLDIPTADIRLHSIIEMLPQAVCVFDAEDRYVLWNQKYAELYSDIADYLQPGMPFEDILRISLAGDEMREVVEDKETWLIERMEKFRCPVSQEEQQLRDGRWLRHDDRRTPDGGAIGMRIDITELKQREDWLGQLFDANPMPMLLCDGDSLDIIQANQAACTFYGLDMAELLSRKACDMHVQNDARRFAAAILGLDGHCDARTIWRQKSADGHEHHVLIYVRLLHEGQNRRLLLTIADVSEQIAAEDEANHLAHHDILTGLPNRMQFYKVLTEALNAADKEPLFAFYLDLGGFKPVNDTFGHAAGDEVLKMVADRLRTEAQGEMIARLGGDEFAILMRGDYERAADLANRCIATCEHPFNIRGLAIRISVSIGVASAGLNCAEGDTLLQEADRALYRAKAEGRRTWRMASGGLSTKAG